MTNRSSQSWRGPPASDPLCSTHGTASQSLTTATRTARNLFLIAPPAPRLAPFVLRCFRIGLRASQLSLTSLSRLTSRPTHTSRNLFLTSRRHRFAPARPLSLTLPTLKTPRPTRQPSLPSLSLLRPLPLLLPFFLLLYPSPAQAQLSPGNSCSTAGQATLTNSNPAYLLVCDGSTWDAALTYEYVSGIGGALMNMATDSGSCTTAKTGELNYNSGSPEFCNGASWAPFGSSITGTIGTAGTGLTVELAAGSAASPSLTFHEDTSTGLFQAGNADYLYVTTGGIERAAFDSSGNFDLDNGSETSAGGYQINGTTVLMLPDKDPTSIAVGQSALAGQSSINLYNTAVGDGALNHDTSGYTNTAIGNAALAANTSGNDDTAIGSYALQNNTIGGPNTAVGYGALGSTTSGNNNTALGYNAGEYVTTGADDIAIGASAMVSTSAHPLTATSAGNIAIGDNALTSITGGATSNVAIGYNALTKSTVSSTAPNTAVGMNAMEWATTATNNTA